MNEKAIISKFLKKQAGEVYDGLMETIQNSCFMDYDVEFINASTPKKDLPLYLNDKYSPLVQLLARNKLAGKSEFVSDLIKPLEKIVSDNVDMDDIANSLSYYSGQFRVISNMYDAIDNCKMAKVISAWARFSPYD